MNMLDKAFFHFMDNNIIEYNLYFTVMKVDTSTKTNHLFYGTSSLPWPQFTHHPNLFVLKIQQTTTNIEI